MSDMLTRKADVLDFLRKHPGWVLQFCRGVRSEWWWLRSSPTSSDIVRVHATAAWAAKREMRKVNNDWTTRTYALRTPEK